MADHNDDNDRGQILGELICQGNRHSLYHGNNIIGTTTSRCDVTILDKSISDVHAVIKVDSNSMSLFDLRSSEGTFMGQRGGWKRVNHRDFLVESCSELRFGSVVCSLRFPVVGSDNGDSNSNHNSNSSVMVRGSEEIETQAMDENFLMLPPTGRISSSSSSYRAMIASAVTQVMDDTSLLVDELGDDTIDDEDGVGNGNGEGLQVRKEDLMGEETHTEGTLTPPQSPSPTDFPAAMVASLPPDVVEEDDDRSSQESADLFHVDVAIADTLVDDGEDMHDASAAAAVAETDVPLENTIFVPAARPNGKKRSRLDEESSDDDGDDDDDDDNHHSGGERDEEVNKSALVDEQEDATLTLVGELPTQIIDIIMPDDLIDHAYERADDDGNGNGEDVNIEVAGPLCDPSSPAADQQRLRMHSTPPEPIVSPLLRLPDLETVSDPFDAPVQVAEEAASSNQNSISASGPQKMKKRAKIDAPKSLPSTKPRKGKQQPQLLLQQEEIEREAEEGAIERVVVDDQVAGIESSSETAVPAAAAVASTPTNTAAAKKATAAKKGAGKGKARTAVVSVPDDGDVNVSPPNAVEMEKVVTVPEAVVVPLVASSDPGLGGTSAVGVGKRGSRAATAAGSKKNAETAASTSSSSSSSSSTRGKKAVPVEERGGEEQMKDNTASLVESDDAVAEVATATIPDQPATSKAVAKKRGRAAAAVATAESIPSASLEEGPPQKQTKARRVTPAAVQSSCEVSAEREPEKGSSCSVRFTSPVVDKLVEFSPAMDSSASLNNPAPSGRRASRRNDPPASSPSPSETAAEPPSPLSQSFALSPRTVANTLINQGGQHVEDTNTETETTEVVKKGKKATTTARNQPLFPASPVPMPAPSSSAKAAVAASVAAGVGDESVVRILFTALPEDLISKEDAEIMAGKIAGALVVEDPTEATHVIMGDDLKRTPNLLVALNSGAKYVLYLSWLRDSSKKGAPLQIASLAKSKYIVRDKKKEALWGFSMERTLASPRSREGGVFSGYGFHYQVEGVTTVPPPEKMRTIIESGGGRWVQNLQGGEAVSSAEALSVLVVTCPEAIQAAWPPFRQLLAQLLDTESATLTCQIVGDGNDATGPGKKKKPAEDGQIGAQVVGVFAVEAVLLAALRQELDLTESANSHRIDLRALLPVNSNANSNGPKKKDKDKSSRRT